MRNSENRYSSLRRSSSPDVPKPKRRTPLPTWLTPSRWEDSNEETLTAEDEANAISKLLFAWILPVIWTSTAQCLELKNFPLLNPDRECQSMTNNLKTRFLRCVDKGRRRPLLRAMIITSWRSLLLAFSLSVGSLIIDYANIVVFYFLWRYLEHGQQASAAGRETPTYREGVMWVGIICAVHLVVDMAHVHAHYASRMVDASLKTSLIGLVLDKWLTVDPNADLQVDDGPSCGQTRQAGQATGDVMTLATVHSQRIGELSVNTIAIIQYLFNYPCVAAWLGFYFGWIAAVSVGIMVLFTVIAIAISLHALGVRRRANIISDQRIRKLEGILMGITLVKYFGWEKYLADGIFSLRKDEIKETRRAMLMTTVHSSISSSSINYAALAAFALYARSHSLEGNPAIVISGIVFLCLDRNTWSLFRAIVMFLNSWPSVARMERYLLARSQADTATVQTPPDGLALQLSAASFEWTQPSTSMSTQENFAIGPLTLQLREGEIVAIVGPSQAGKSTLLYGLIGDMPLKEGQFLIRGPPVYCPQLAWLQSDTIRQNILFSRRFRPEIYDQVLDACGLKADIEKLPNADQCEVGETGVRLSGGQKHRVHLARCLYQALVSDCSLVLLDDPLSAVDAMTASLIFDRAITRSLTGKCRVLVTHQLHVLSRCDRVIFLRDGQVHGDGTFSHLIETSNDFRAFVGAHGQSAIWQITPRMSLLDACEEHIEASEIPEVDMDPTIVEDEERAPHKIPSSLYLSFVSSVRAKCTFAFNTLLLILSQVAVALISLQTAWWTSNQWNLSYAGNILLYLVFTLTHQITWSLYNYRSQDFIIDRSWTLSSEALRGLLSAPMSFYRANPIGRLVNRFTEDISELDTLLPIDYWNFTLPIFFALSTLGTVTAYVPFMVALLIPWLAVGAVIFVVYKYAPLETKRLSINLSSKYLALLHEGLVGRTAIKLADHRKGFLSSYFARIDDYNRVQFCSFAMFECASLAHSTSYLLMMFCGGLVLVARRFEEGAAELTLVYGLFIITSHLQQTILEQGSNCLKGINAAERLKHFAEDLPKEGMCHDNGGGILSEVDDKPWSSSGAIKFQQVSLQYKPPQFVLKDMSFEIKAGEKIGVVGRTGAGKSSLIAALLRLEPLARGSIHIGDVDINALGLHDLRHAISTIPQDPQMFLGTVRFNLDPMEQFNDDRLNTALDRVFPSRDLNDPRTVTLDTRVQAGGTNFSSGELQMLSLARALARQSKIVMLDEATSNVDPAMDIHIQEVIREAFVDCTVLTIAHRLRTVLRYDRVLVLDKGKVVEFDTPMRLFTKPGGGYFRDLCDQSVIVIEDFT